MSKFIKLSLFCCLVILTIFVFSNQKSKKALSPIKIGLLHSKTGLMAYADFLTKEIAQFAVDEINQDGGLLGRSIEIVFTADAKSDSNLYAEETEKLIAKDKVCAIFGGGLSITRKRIKSIIERYNNVLFYTWRHEGLEMSNNIVYIGATANQQVYPAIWWSLNNLGTTFYLLGSDNIYSRATHEIMKDHILSLGGKIKGEAFFPLGSTNVASLVKKIKDSKANVVLHSVIGLETNNALFDELSKQKLTAEKLPIMTFSLSEPDLLRLNLDFFEGNFATWNYFQNTITATNTNENFIAKFKNKFGEKSVIGDPMETLYVAIKLWAAAVKKVNSINPPDVINGIKNISMFAPEKTIYIDNNNHAWRSVIIGSVKRDGQFLVQWESRLPIEPNPYPITRKKGDWEGLIKKIEGNY